LHYCFVFVTQNRTDLNQFHNLWVICG
jgi:hypothetical protein